MIVDSIENGPYVRQMIATPVEPDLYVPVPESFNEQTNEELIENDIKRMDADDQAIQTILLGLLKDVYAALDSCETAKEIWKRFRQMMKGSNIREHEKNVKLFYEWEKKIAANLKFLNNLQPKWKRHVTIVRQTKNLHEADFTQIYDFLKMNQDEVNELRVQRLTKPHDPLALMAHSQNSYNFLTTHNEQSSSSTHSQQSFLINNKYNPQPSLNQNFLKPPMTSLEDINDPTEAMNAALILFAKVFQLTAPTNNNQRTSSNHHNRQIAQPVINMSQDKQIHNVGGNDGNQFRQYAGKVAHNQQGHIAWQNGIANQNGTGNVVVARAEARPMRRDVAYLQTQLLIAQKEEAGIKLQAEEFDFMAASGDLDEIEEVNANCILMANLQHASTSGTQLDKAPIYDTNGLAEPIPEPQLVSQNDNHVTSVALSMVQSGGTVETSSTPNEETPSVSHDIMSIVKNGFVDVPSDLQNELDRMKEKLELCLIKKEKEYAVLWYNWYTKCEECKYDKISYDKAYNDMQQKDQWLQTQLRDLKGKSSDTPSASNTLDSLNQKLKSKIIELEFQVVNYEREISHLKTTYKNLFDSITSNRAHAKLHNLIYGNTQLRARVFENTSESMNNTSGMSVTPHVDKPKLSAVTPHSKKLHASILLHSVPQPREFNVMKHRNENVSSYMVNASATGLVHTARTRRPQPKGNTRNAKVPSSSKSSNVKKNVTVEDHRRTLLLSKNQKNMSSECNDIKLAIRNDKSEIVYGNCNANQKRHKTQVWKPKQVGFKETLVCTPEPRPPRFSLKWSPSGRSFDLKGKLVASKETNCPNDEKACTSNPHEPMRKRFPNSTVFLGRLSKFVCGTVRFGNDHIAAILEVAFRRNTCIIRDLDSVDLLKGNHSTNLYTINLYDMVSASSICLMARATPTKSWLWHQRLSHLNFDTINNLAKNNLVSGLPKFKYAKEHLCPSCEQRKRKRASHPPKPVPNSKQRLHLLHMDLCGPMLVASINGKRYVLVIVDDYSRYTWVHFLRSKDETPEQNEVVERRNRMLVEAARTMLIFSHAPLFLWAEAIATACYTQNLHKEYLGGRPSKAPRATLAAPGIQNLQAPTASMSFQDSAPAPTKSSNTPVSSHNVDAPSQQHA
nr:hypothetical protein [Tanacetum cinerariifolium]